MRKSMTTVTAKLRRFAYLRAHDRPAAARSARAVPAEAEARRVVVLRVFRAGGRREGGAGAPYRSWGAAFAPAQEPGRDRMRRRCVQARDGRRFSDSACCRFFAAMSVKGRRRVPGMPSLPEGGASGAERCGAAACVLSFAMPDTFVSAERGSIRMTHERRGRNARPGKKEKEA